MEERLPDVVQIQRQQPFYMTNNDGTSELIGFLDQSQYYALIDPKNIPKNATELVVHMNKPNNTKPADPPNIAEKASSERRRLPFQSA